MSEEKPNKAESKDSNDEKPVKSAGKIAVIRIRGPNKKGNAKNDTLDMLRLHRKNYCVILDKTPSILGMIKKIESIVTWGEIDDLTIKELKAKKGAESKFFRLAPPVGGFERKGIKTPFALGGAIGYRGDKIKDLIKRMLQ